MDASSGRTAAGCDPLGGRGDRRDRRAARLGRGLGLALAALSFAATSRAQDADPWGPRIDELAAELESGPALVALEELSLLVGELEERTLRGEIDAGSWNALVRSWLLRADRDPNAQPLEAVLASATERGGGELGAALHLAVADELVNRGDAQGAERLLAAGDGSCGEATHGLVSLRVELAHLALERGAFADAFRQLDAAETALARVADVRRALYAHFEIAARRSEAYLMCGLPDVADGSIDEEERLAAELGRPELLDVALLHRVQYLIAVGRCAEAARRSAERASARPGDVPAALRVLRAAALLEQTFEANDVAPGTVEALREALAVEDPLAQRKARLRWAEWCLFEKRVDEAAASLAPFAGELERGALALDDELVAADLLARLELARPRESARADGAEHALDTARMRLERAFDRFQDAWRSSPRRAGGVGFLHYGTRRRVLATLVRLALELDRGASGMRRALETVYRAQTLGQMARFSGLGAGALDDALAVLARPGHGVLLYLPGRLETHLFALDHERFVHEELGPPHALEELGRACAQRLLAGRGDSQEARELALELAGALLPESVRARLAGWSHVTVIGEGQLGAAPFECLPLGDATLGERIATSHLSSLPLAVLLARRARPAAPELELLLVAAPELAAEDAPSLSFEAEEERRAIRAFDARRALVLSGARATREALAREIGRTRVLAFLAHGLREAGSERPAAIALAKGGESDLLGSAEIEGLAAPELVVVWSCGAARGPIRRGEDELPHVGGAFLAAGARAVVVSPVELEYELALEMQQVFFERLRAHGDSPAEALRRARTSGREHPGRRFVQIFGLGAEPVFPRGE